MTVRHFLRDDDLTAEEQREVLDRALSLKADPFSDRCLEGPRTVSILFDKPTLRTQVSFVGAVTGLGGFPMVVDGRLAGVGERESVADVARILGPQSAAVVWRTFAQADLEEMARHAGVPTVNALTDDFHPCQVLADLLTVRESRGELAGLALAYLGDGANNMAHSYLLGCALAGMHVRIGAPASHRPAAAVVARAEELAAAHGGSVTVTDDPAAAATGADVVATDTWVSMGQEAEKQERFEQFEGYTVDDGMMALADPTAVFMHCLPAYRGIEVTADVIDGPRSVVFQQGHNRLHAARGAMAFLLGARPHPDPVDPE